VGWTNEKTNGAPAQLLSAQGKIRQFKPKAGGPVKEPMLVISDYRRLLTSVAIRLARTVKICSRAAGKATVKDPPQFVGW